MAKYKLSSNALVTLHTCTNHQLKMPPNAHTAIANIFVGEMPQFKNLLTEAMAP